MAPRRDRAEPRDAERPGPVGLGAGPRRRATDRRADHGSCWLLAGRSPNAGDTTGFDLDSGHRCTQPDLTFRCSSRPAKAWTRTEDLPASEAVSPVIGCICQRPKVRRIASSTATSAGVCSGRRRTRRQCSGPARKGAGVGRPRPDQRLSASVHQRRRCCRLRWARAGSSDSKPSRRKACHTSSSWSSRACQRPATARPYARINVGMLLTTIGRQRQCGTVDEDQLR